ncbi:Thioredoxin [Metarhizium rileyi]|uniref:Thioredoxin n=1 Tax=Metarhizium rileyi (strain RCEF 4871) TaxID=1649241 RepID=A0A167DQN7_METRR|nr:Thioredoxin [Metarhizium rileyi RCEF 4871]
MHHPVISNNIAPRTFRSGTKAAAAAATLITRPHHRAAASWRTFQSTTPARQPKNQVYNPIRSPDSLNTYLSLSSSSRTPLLTLWTASWCPTCRTVLPLIRSLVESGAGQSEGGVAFAPVEFDSPDIMSSSSYSENLAMTYMITSIPTLLSFDAGEAQTATKVTDARKLADRQFLMEWIQNEATRHGRRGGGGGDGGPGSSVFGGLFGRKK